MTFWEDQRVLVTGGAGFLGSFIVEKLRGRGYRNIVVPRSRDYDLRDAEAARRLLRDSDPTLVLHLAARVGGIGANRAQPVEFFYDNLLVRLNLFYGSWRHGVDRYVDAGLRRTVEWLRTSSMHETVTQA